MWCLCLSSRRRHTRCALVTGVQTCALPISLPEDNAIAVASIGLDNFKPINDVFGHMVGDRLLRQIGARLETLRGGTDMVARIGGDEFAFLARCVDVRSEERRVGNVCVSTCSSRWAPST